MENKEMVMGIALEKFTWKIETFSKVTTKKLSSKAFKLGGYRWKIVLYPIGENGKNLSLQVKIADSLPAYGWKIFAYFRVALINHFEANNSIAKETQQKFNGGNKSWNSPSFIPLKEFQDPSKGYLVNDTCIIEAQIATSKDIAFNISDIVEVKEPEYLGISPLSPTSTHESKDDVSETELQILQHEHQGIGPLDETPSPKQVQFVPSAPPMYPHLSNEHEEVFLTPLAELIDFKSLEPEESAFIPLWEEVCSCHPSLVENQGKRSPRFILWAFLALGQVLHFLKTKKIRDMGEDGTMHLKVLWDELQSFGFDLTWLEPHVQSALGTKAYLERAHQVKNLRADVATLDIEMRKLKAKLAVEEIDLEVTRRHLAKVENGFEERDMDVVLGYGIP
ncbi:hypothetical protein Lal_00018211 [Lupinus albus]|uniref:Putative ubiquitinyl hydrolase 1 n=1 Tax=Lupinus albus TaxID=3870 RepID=A0A6A4MMU0_LUPAL|nr:putative ubiquitinyl hydrolase 1 [Lupinus albus]KAF1866825.1 hypothetical protein Lal_00018211 [Lupinus albus]